MEELEVSKELFRYNNQDYVDKISRLYKWMHEKKAFPYKLIMYPTNRCNLSCPYCPNSFARASGRFKKEDELTEEDWITITKESLTLGIKEYRIFGGGEPMVRSKTTIDIVNLVKNHDINLNCEIITNGSLFTDEIVKNLVSKKLDRLLISIDGPDSKTHDSLRGIPGTFERTKKAFKLFKILKKKFRTDKPVIQVNMVVNNKNYNKIAKMVKVMHKLGVNELALHSMRSYEETSSQVKSLWLNSEEEKKAETEISKAKTIAKKLNLNLNIDMIEEEKNRNSNETNKPKFLSPLCFEPFYTLFIDPKGNVAPCCGPGVGYKDCNVKQKSLKEIWFSNKFNLIRKEITEGKPKESCFSCGLLDMTKELRDDLLKFENQIKKC